MLIPCQALTGDFACSIRAGPPSARRADVRMRRTGQREPVRDARSDFRSAFSRSIGMGSIKRENPPGLSVRNTSSPRSSEPTPLSGDDLNAGGGFIKIR